MIARASSGSRSSISSIEPLMSAKRAVMVLRSPSGGVSEAEIASRRSFGGCLRMTTEEATASVAIVSASGVAHLPQNFLGDGFSEPHLEHVAISGAAQSPQNFISVDRK